MSKSASRDSTERERTKTESNFQTKDFKLYFDRWREKGNPRSHGLLSGRLDKVASDLADCAIYHEGLVALDAQDVDEVAVREKQKALAV